MRPQGVGLGELLRSDDDPPDCVEGRRLGKAAVRSFFKAIATRDREAFSAVVTDDVVHEIPFSESGATELGGFRRFVGKDEVVSFWMGVADAGIKAAAPEEIELSVNGDGSRLFIEQRGNMTMPDGRSYRNRYVFRFDVRDGRISRSKEYFNPVTAAAAFDRPLGRTA